MILATFSPTIVAVASRPRTSRVRTPDVADPLPDGNPGVEEVRFQAWRHYVEAHGYVVALMADDLDAERRLPIAWYQVLLLLNEAPDRRMAMSELNELVTLSQPGVSRLVDRIERAGLVRRERSDEDRRSVSAVITIDGLEELAKAAPIHRDGIQRWFTDSLSDHEAAVLARALGRIHASARDELHRRRLFPRSRP
jgi:DNA-binding MarR family transcriptional regulator